MSGRNPQSPALKTIVSAYECLATVAHTNGGWLLQLMPMMFTKVRVRVLHMLGVQHFSAHSANCHPQQSSMTPVAAQASYSFDLAVEHVQSAVGCLGIGVVLAQLCNCGTETTAVLSGNYRSRASHPQQGDCPIEIFREIEIMASQVNCTRTPRSRYGFLSSVSVRPPSPLDFAIWWGLVAALSSCDGVVTSVDWSRDPSTRDYLV